MATPWRCDFQRRSYRNSCKKYNNQSKQDI